MGVAPFEAAVAASLDKPEASALLAALATPARAGAGAGAGRGGVGARAPTMKGAPGAGRGGGASRPSIREQMMAARRKKEAEGKGGDGFVVVT